MISVTILDLPRHKAIGYSKLPILRYSGVCELWCPLVVDRTTIVVIEIKFYTLVIGVLS